MYTSVHGHDQFRPPVQRTQTHGSVHLATGLLPTTIFSRNVHTSHKFLDVFVSFNTNFDLHIGTFALPSKTKRNWI